MRDGADTMKPAEIVQAESEARYERRRHGFAERDEALANLQAGTTEGDWRAIDEPTRIAQRAASLGLTADAASLLANPENQALGRRVLEQIIDANNLLDIRFLPDGARASRAVGQVRLPVPGGTRLGTGFMVTAGLMMTNHHVLQSADEAGAGILRFDFYRRADGATTPVIDFALRPDWFFVTDDELDFSIVAVETTNRSGARAADRGWLPLIGPSGKAIVGERVNIIQHPGGLPQQVAIHENRIVDFDEDWLWYVTDTQGGSSGSPVLNDQWELAALHHAATTIAGGKKANEGARISRIVTWLQDYFSGRPEEESVVYGSGLLSGEPPPEGLVAGLGVPWASGAGSWTVPLTFSVSVGEPPTG